ncbi:hypothetical protein AMAG_19523 [Allomyces macrogynus ATCC 38327]|uniref:J domain-containing protein n=1 Tax=Allomyces macrogynus (strain ATCC 38327) TaxID=578462 RepID=A0A0L0SWN3_ALLM3|nr:hypothetical protein AMAG_19523 [Allomyces macrogynus ATCC 38327]|eukprot:KNE66810.1 hypothetical protein AMAG_19523 [Allomyces macrogynus ATCC 38327]
MLARRLKTAVHRSAAISTMNPAIRRLSIFSTVPRSGAAFLRAATGIPRRTMATAAHVSFYDVLEVTPAADKRKIKAAYYRLSKLHHPDVNASPEAKAKFLALSEAYETLGNDHKRREYDRMRLRHSTSNLRHAPRNSVRNSVRERKYGVHEAAARSKHYNHDAHQRGHYGMGESEGSAWHQDRMERKRQEEAATHKLLYQQSTEASVSPGPAARAAPL